MTKRVSANGAVWIIFATVCGCNLGEVDAPDVPDDYPQLGAFESGKAELVVGGESLVTKETGGTTYDPGGLNPDPLPARMSFDYTLYLDFLEPEEGTYTAADGELSASWSSGGGYSLDGSCGEGTLVVVGRSEDAGLVNDAVIWGTMQLELCEETENPTGRLAITGRFSSTVTEL
jgi:hypothetical protein